MDTQDFKCQVQRKAACEAEKIAALFRIGGVALLIAGVSYLVPNISKAAEQNAAQASQLEKTWEEILPSKKTDT